LRRNASKMGLKWSTSASTSHSNLDPAGRCGRRRAPRRARSTGCSWLSVSEPGWGGGSYEPEAL
jgi:hypothetical protein